MADRVVNATDTVAVHNVLRLDNGEIVDSSRDRNEQLTFKVGADQVIEGFDHAVRGMAVGQSVTVEVSPDRGYGEHDAELIADFPRAQAPEGVAIGDKLQVEDRPALVVGLDNEKITLDRNHPLAGLLAWHGPRWEPGCGGDS